MIRLERLIAADDGTPLYFSWHGLEATTPPVGTLLLTHGLGEHSGRYGHLVELMLKQGFEVARYDLRGHGRSGGRRGDAPGFGRFLDDLELLLDEVDRLRADASKPLFLFGHSMGGLAVLRFLEEHRCERVAGAIVAAPWIRLAFSPEWWKLAAAGLARWVVPGYRQITGLDSTRLSRDRQFAELLPDRSLGHHLLSARLFYDIHRTCLRALAEAPECRTPLLLLHGEADPVTSHQATAELFAQIGSADKELLLYPEMVHELHNDLNRDAVLRDISTWLTTHAEATPMVNEKEKTEKIL